VKPVVLVVTGPPGSGKTTVATALARELCVPYFSKDFFKESLFETLGWSDRAWSQRLGEASMALLFQTASAILRAGHSVVLESNFYARSDEPQLLALGVDFGCRFVQVVCTAPPEVLVERFVRREETGERHPGHAGPASFDALLPRIRNERWDAMALPGPVLTVDTTNADVDIPALARDINTLLASDE
jgi:predicted kinase